MPSRYHPFRYIAALAYCAEPRTTREVTDARPGRGKPVKASHPLRAHLAGKREGVAQGRYQDLIATLGGP